MFPDKTWFKSAMRFGLLFYSIFASIGGTIPIITLLLFVLPPEDAAETVIPFAIMLIPLYISCIIALIVRAKFFKKQEVPISDSNARTPDEEFSLQAKSFLKKALRGALLIYPIVIGAMSTIMFALFIFLLIPKEGLTHFVTPLVIAAIFLYGSCILAIWIRTKVPRQ